MNTLRILAMGDNHGDEESLRRVVEDTAGEKFDFVIHTGDITNTSKTSFEKGVSQLQSLEPLFESLAERGEFVYIYGNRDSERSGSTGHGHVTDGFELTPGHRLRHGESIVVGGQGFTTAEETATPEDILLTHQFTQRQLYRSNRRAYFCGHSHDSRQVGRSLNTGYLWKADNPPGAYFVVELGEHTMTVDVHGVVEPWEKFECPIHDWYGTQFRASSSECRLCDGSTDRPFRYIVAEAFAAATEPPSATHSLPADELVRQARSLFVDTDAFGRQVSSYLDSLVEKETPGRKDPIRPTRDGALELYRPTG